MTDDNRDWREWAYLDKGRWPEAIPEMGPKREYGPYPWGEKVHYDPHGLDDYPHTNPSAASCGDLYMGDVCPYCGVPVRLDNELVNINGQKGQGFEVSPNEHPKPVYHPECWKEREAIKHRENNATLEEYV